MGRRPAADGSWMKVSSIPLFWVDKAELEREILGVWGVKGESTFRMCLEVLLPVALVLQSSKRYLPFFKRLFSNFGNVNFT